VRVRNPYEADADSFEEQQAARSAMAQIQMEGLKHSMQRTASKSPAVGAPDGNFYTASSKMMKRCGGTPDLRGGHAPFAAGSGCCRTQFALTVCVATCSVTKKMTQKYGEFTQDPAFQASGAWYKVRR